MKRTNRTIIVIEDSSKAKFGGGQKVTLSVLSILHKYSKRIILFDTNEQSYFYQSSCNYLSIRHHLYSFGIIKNGIIGKIYKVIELLLLPFCLTLNCIIVYRKTKSIKNKILYTTTKKSLLIGYLLNLFCSTSYIYHAHLIEKNPIISRLVTQMCKNAEKVIAVSKSVLISINNCKNTYIIPNPINCKARSQPRILKNKIRVGLFASLIKIKGIDYFIDSHKYLSHKNDVEYWIYGEGKYKNQLIKKSNSQIKFKGFTNNTINEMNNNIDILCFPSIIEESFGISIIEAFSCGIPVITTNIGGQSELVQNDKYGYLVPIKSSEEIANKIDYLIDNPSIYTNISKNVINKSSDYIANKFEIKILNVFFQD